MFGLDDKVAGLSDGPTLLVVVAVSILLGLRHASDPDHVAAVTTLIASGRERASRSAAKLGFVWGLGHATTLFLFGLPVVLYSAYLPEPVQAGAETGVGAVIVALALLLLLRWRRGAFSGAAHVHRTRTRLQAYGIGLVHGMGGTAGVGLLLLATIHSHTLAVVALALFAGCTALSMAALSTGLGTVLGKAPSAYQTPKARLTMPRTGAIRWIGAQGVLPYML